MHKTAYIFGYVFDIFEIGETVILSNWAMNRMIHLIIGKISI